MLSSYHRVVCSALSIVGTVGLVAMSDPVAANVRSTVPQVSVSYADLDMTSPEGRATLDERIAQAAQDVCRSNGIEPLSISMACHREVIADARHAAGLDRNG